MKKRLVVAAAVASLATAVAVPLAVAAPQHTTTSSVYINAVKNGLAYNKKTLHANAGTVAVVFTNLSHLKHNVRFEIGEKEYGGTKTIGHGTTKVTLTLAKGKYHYYCSVPGHEDAGMSGYLYVK